MTSSIVSWYGSLPDEDIQIELCNRLLCLAQISGTYFPTDKPPRLVDKTLIGGVLVPPYILSGHILNYPLKKSGDHLRYALERVSLYGVEIEIYDWRPRPILSSTMSFIFIRNENNPLDGRIVETYNLRSRRSKITSTHIGDDGVATYFLSDNKAIRTTDRDFDFEEDWLLQGSGIHLRYYLEKWIRRFLTWMKTYYIKDLVYYDRFEGMPEVIYSPKARSECNQEWEVLLQEFSEEADRMKKIGENEKLSKINQV